MFYVYILKSQIDAKRIYTGYTTSVKRRLVQHNKGDCKHTSKYCPWVIICYCGFNDKHRAFAFERYLKSASGIALINKRLV